MAVEHYKTSQCLDSVSYWYLQVITIAHCDNLNNEINFLTKPFYMTALFLLIDSAVNTAAILFTYNGFEL